MYWMTALPVHLRPPHAAAQHNASGLMIATFGRAAAQCPQSMLLAGSCTGTQRQVAAPSVLQSGKRPARLRAWRCL